MQKLPSLNDMVVSEIEENTSISRANRSIPATKSQPFSAAVNTVSVVIVNFCQWKNTIRLVKQLRRSEAIKSRMAEIIIVDNGSQKSKWATKLENLKYVKIDHAEKNLGFAAAVNRGSKQAIGEWFLLLNPDVTVEDEFLDHAISAIEKVSKTQPNAAVIGFQLRNRDGSTQPSCGRWPTLFNTITGVFSPRWRRKCQPRLQETATSVAWATGGCLMIRKDCFEKLNGFDDSYFLYYEDVDFCKRATEAGFEVWYTPDAQVTHHWPLHSRPVPAPLRLITRHALITYSRTHWPRWQSWLLGRITKCESWLRQIWSKRAGNNKAAEFYKEIRSVVSEIESGKIIEARVRIDYAAEHLAAVAAAQDGRTV